MKVSELLDRIDEVRANSVTDEEFEKIHGKSVDDMVKEVMETINEKTKCNR